MLFILPQRCYRTGTKDEPVSAEVILRIEAEGTRLQAAEDPAGLVFVATGRLSLEVHQRVAADGDLVGIEQQHELGAQPAHPVLLDDQEVVQRRYGVNRFPESFVIRKDGVIDDKIIGAIDWAAPGTVAYFRDLLLR